MSQLEGQFLANQQWAYEIRKVLYFQNAMMGSSENSYAVPQSMNRKEEKGEAIQASSESGKANLDRLEIREKSSLVRWFDFQEPWNGIPIHNPNPHPATEFLQQRLQSAVVCLVEIKVVALASVTAFGALDLEHMCSNEQFNGLGLWNPRSSRDFFTLS